MKLNPFNRIPDGPRRTAAQAVSVVLFMGAMAWAAVPFYNWFCKVTGFGGTTGTAVAEADVILDRTMKVRFVASVEDGLPWEFRPLQNEMELRIGQTGQAFYEVTNTSDHPIAASAAYNVAPYEAGGYFTKIDCFCFELQVVQPGQTVVMPVQYYIDPEIVDDRDAKHVNVITLGYTFYQTAMPDDLAQLSPDIDPTGPADASVPVSTNN